MTDHLRYETFGTSALQPADVPTFRLYDGGAVRRHAARGAVRRGFGLRLMLAATLVTAVVVAAVCAVDGAREARATATFDTAPHEVTYVQTGDSLWSIAERQGGGEADTARLVSWIREANGLTGSDLREGDPLVVPVLGQ